MQQSIGDNIIDSTQKDSLGTQMHRLISELYPICRSITGNGVRDTLAGVKKIIPLDVHEVPSGTKVFDWVVPKEWNIREAYIRDSKGNKIIDFEDSNLHVLNYSVPVRKQIALKELKEHLFSMPDRPDWIPYRTSYYDENWGFCIEHNKLNDLKDENYEVLIDSSLEDGHLTYGEYYIQGRSKDEVLISTHICHPSLCNDNLSGIAIATFLAMYLSKCSLKYSYRFLFIPGTIGSITWLSLNEKKASNIKHGLVATCLGNSGNFTYKRSRRGDAEIDRAVELVLRDSGRDFKVVDFSPYGYDERQYCSPGFDLPVGCLMRTAHGEFPEYHTSADNLDFVEPDYLEDAFSKFVSILNVIESDNKYLNCNPKCEPQLGKRGLYKIIGGHTDSDNLQLAMLWVLNLSDGKHSLLDVAERSKIDFDVIKHAAKLLLDSGLLEGMDES